MKKKHTNNSEKKTQTHKKQLETTINNVNFTAKFKKISKQTQKSQNKKKQQIKHKNQYNNKQEMENKILNIRRTIQNQKQQLQHTNTFQT